LAHTQRERDRETERSHSSYRLMKSNRRSDTDGFFFCSCTLLFHHLQTIKTSQLLTTKKKDWSIKDDSQSIKDSSIVSIQEFVKI
jgi:hypothetical protein